MCTYPDCEEKGDSAAHTFGDLLTNENGHYQACTVCGYSTQPNHRFESDWVIGENGHYHKCVYCELTKDEEEHDYEWDFYTSEEHCLVCSGCGHVTDVGEHVVDKWDYNEKGHWGQCFCGEDLTVEAHNFSKGVITVGDDGETSVKRYYCISCGYFYDEPLDHTHIFEDGWRHNSSGHWHYCTVCKDDVDNSAHDYIVKVTLEPTETEAGARVYTCTVCGYAYTETIPELGHVHKFDTGWNNNETAHWHDCVCGEKADIVSHVSDGGKVTVQPTAALSGVKTYTCTVCGYIIKTETIPALSPTPNVPDTAYYPPAAATDVPLKTPCVGNAPEAEGWLNIAAYINASPDGAVIPITMNGENELPREITECIMDRDITLKISMSEGPVWTLNGRDVLYPETVNMRVSEQSNRIPSRVLDGIVSEFEPKEYRLYHSGDFGFLAELTLNVGSRYNGYYAVLYHYNTGTKQLEFVDESLVENRFVTFELTHASYYAVAFNSFPMYDNVSSHAGVFENSIPIETSAMPETSGVTVPAVKLPQIMKYSNKKRRYRVLKKRRLDDLVFVL